MDTRIHLWLGSNFAPEAEYRRYFELDYRTEGDFDDPQYRVCGFCEDIGERWYDEDFIGVLDRLPQAVALDALLGDAPLAAAARADVLARCAALGITQGNALFWLQAPQLDLAPLRPTYNGLHYIGLFEGD